MTIAANVKSSAPVTSITVFLDGTHIDVEGGGKSVTEQTFFTSSDLAAGTHTVRAVKTDQTAGRAETEWAFTVFAPSATVAPAITLSYLNPPPGSSITARAETMIAANIVSTTLVTSVTVYLDGQQISAEVGGQNETRQAFFIGRILGPGNHTARAVATNQGGGRTEAAWSFTAVAGPTVTSTRRQ